MVRLIPWLLLAWLLPAFLALALPRAASAHAVLLQTTPEDGAVLDAAPREVRLDFNEPVSPVAIRLLGADGAASPAAGAAEAAGASIRLPVAAGLAQGSHLVSYRVVSADGHPVGGSFVFSVGAPDAGPAELADEARREAGWRLAAAIDRAVLHLALFLGAGGALFLLLVDGEDRASVRSALRAATLLAAIAAALSVGLEGGLLAAATPAALLDPATWRLGGSTSVGAAMSVAVPAALTLAAGLSLPAGGAATILTVAGTVAVLASFGFSGHAATASPRWLTTPAVIAHVTAGAFWLGALPLLHRALRPATIEAAMPAIRRFSGLALAAVPVLAVAGLALACIQLGRPPALVDTDYGLLLLGKLGLVALLLALAAWNKLRLTPALAQGSQYAGRQLRRSILAEILLIAAILAITACLGHTPPPRALAAQHAGHVASGYAVYTSAGGIAGMVTLDPARRGPTSLAIELGTAADNTPLGPVAVEVALSLPSLGVEPIRLEAKPLGEGRYRIPLTLPVAGDWTVEIAVLVTDFRKTTLSATIPVR